MNNGAIVSHCVVLTQRQSFSFPMLGFPIIELCQLLARALAAACAAMLLFVQLISFLS